MTTTDPVWELEQSQLKKQRALYDLMDDDESEVQRFYAGLTIFITGGTGFLGKLLIEKLLRACPKVRRIYLLIRSKKAKDPTQRLAEIFVDPLYNEVRKRQPNFMDKVCLVTGDITELGLGLSERDRYILSGEVNVIFHVAATVRFDEPLKKAVLTNVRGTREVFFLARSCGSLRSLVHVSTAYCNCPWKTIEEKFYDHPIKYHTMIGMAESLDEEKLAQMTTVLLESWPNTYTFTKAMAENVVRDMSEDLPVSVFRPAIVTATYKEPTPGWCDNSCVYGPTGVLIGVGLGILKTFLADPECDVDVVPGDYVNNALITIACKTSKEFPNEDQCKIYTYSSSNRNPIGWEAFRKILEDSYWMVSPRTVWYATASIQKNKLAFFITSLLLHIIPGYVIDGIAYLLGKDLKMRVMYMKVYRFANIMSYFNLHNWTFYDGNTKQLNAEMSEKDKRYFPCNIEDLDWKEYMQMWVMGLRKYIVKDGLKGTSASVKRQLIYRVGHYSLICLYLYIFWKLIVLLYNVVYLIFV